VWVGAACRFLGSVVLCVDISLVFLSLHDIGATALVAAASPFSAPLICRS